MKRTLEEVKTLLSPKKHADKEWYLALLDEATQLSYETEHLGATLVMLKFCYISRYKTRIAEIRSEIEEIRAHDDYAAKDYRAILEKQAELETNKQKLETYRCFFSEPYFARMDVTDEKEGYNSYYIGKKGDVNLEIVDWRAPLAVRYYQKSRISFQINEYDYKAILRRALSVKNGKVLGFKNEYLSVKEELTPEEIAGRDEEILFDPYLRSIIKSRKDDTKVRDIIETIQEKQFEIITRPERESFVLQGCAGSGKTMILLHRLSYLMYNNESLRPRDVLVITPSDSFNAFIDELSQVLELQKVRTITLNNYYFQALKNEGIELSQKLCGERENLDYLTYLYSDRFPRDMKKDIGKLYGDIYGLFTGQECREVAERVLSDCAARQEKYLRIKNSSVRVRRCVLGEMKERQDGGFYFTKPLRGIMSAFAQAEDFLRYVLKEEVRTPDHFFRQLAEFYRSAQTCAFHAEKAFSSAREDLAALAVQVDKEIADLRRYRRKIGEEYIFTYSDRIARREELKEEALTIDRYLEEMGSGMELFREFFAILRLGGCSEIGKCENATDIVRWLYRKTVRKYKTKYGLKGVYPSDGFALCYMLTMAGRQLKPRFGLVFIDEGQDISASEYELLAKIHSDAAFNIFGDLKQNITPWRGVKNWESANVYELDRNYRNTNEIVEYVSHILDIDMRPIGLHGEEVRTLKPRQVSTFFREKQGLKVVIAREEHLSLFNKRGFKLLSSDGKLSKTKINVMSVYESKGLEFSAVAVYDKDMTENEKYIACTRALRELAIVEEDG